ncbi:hypothetical protein ABTQ08_22165, partial [Acinetobacter baumannii]
DCCANTVVRQYSRSLRGQAEQLSACRTGNVPAFMRCHRSVPLPAVTGQSVGGGAAGRKRAPCAVRHAGRGQGHAPDLRI